MSAESITRICDWLNDRFDATPAQARMRAYPRSMPTRPHRTICEHLVQDGMGERYLKSRAGA